MTFFADFTSGQSNVSYTRMRQLLATSGGGLQEGVIGAGDLKVSQRAAGANPSVDVAVGDGWVQYDTGTRNGLSHVWSDAVANVAINASDATNPRIDQIGVQLNDVAVGAGTGGNTPALRYVPGTATAGATLDNRNGAAAAPSDWLRLADFLVPAGTNSPVTTANIRDRRPNARGAFAEIVYTGTTSQAAPTTFGAIPVISAALQQRVECSGTPLIIELDVSRITSPAAVSNVQANPVVDGSVPAAITDTPGSGGYLVASNAAAAVTAAPTKRWRYTPPAGSHLITINAVGTAGSALFASPTYPLRLTIWEDVRSVFNNGTA